MNWIRNKILARFVQRVRLDHWRRATHQVESLDLGDARHLRGQARQVRREIDRLLAAADQRLALPQVGSDSMRRQHNTDWAWRPLLWRMPISPAGVAAPERQAVLDEETSLHHDCKVSEVTVRQVRNSRATDLSPFGLMTDVYAFDGSFLSLSIKLPDAATRGLKLRHVIRFDGVIEAEKPIEILVRLNIKNGPNIEQLVLALPKGQGPCDVEFDLSHSKVSEKRIERAWVDLFFGSPAMNQIVLRDVTFSRRPRSEI